MPIITGESPSTWRGSESRPQNDFSFLRGGGVSGGGGKGDLEKKLAESNKANTKAPLPDDEPNGGESGVTYSKTKYTAHTDPNAVLDSDAQLGMTFWNKPVLDVDAVLKDIQLQNNIQATQVNTSTLNGISATVLAFVDGATSNIQAQIDAKAGGEITLTANNSIGANSLVYSQAAGIVDEVNMNLDGTLGTLFEYQGTASRPVQLLNVKQLTTDTYVAATFDQGNVDMNIYFLQFNPSTSVFTQYGSSIQKSDGYRGDIDYVSNNKFVLCFGRNATTKLDVCVGTNAGVSAATEIGDGNQHSRIVMLDSTNGVVFRDNGSTGIIAHLFSISGATVTAGNSITVNYTKTSFNNFFYARKISSTQVVLTWSESTGATSYQLGCIFTFTTPNITAGTVKTFSGTWSTGSATAAICGNVMNIQGNYWAFSGVHITLASFNLSTSVITEISSAAISGTDGITSWLHWLGDRYFILGYWNESNRNYYSRLYYFNSVAQTITQQSETLLLNRGGTDDTTAMIAIVPLSPYRAGLLYSQRGSPDVSDERLEIRTANFSQSAVKTYLGIASESAVDDASCTVQINGQNTSMTGTNFGEVYYVGNGGRLYDMTGENGETINEDISLLKVAGVGYDTNKIVMQTFYQN